MLWLQDEDGNWKWDNASLENGLANFEEIVSSLHEYGYDGYINLEDFRGGYCTEPVGITTEEKLVEAYSYLSGLLTGVANE